MGWETIIGLEIHVELNTKSKLFSTAANHFGDEPNCNISPVCTGQPGSLPVLNKEAVRKALQLGLAIEGTIPPVSLFDRKSYFYPDSPRNFQITQFYHPIIMGGHVQAFVGTELKDFAIHHAHLEDDAGTLKHFTNFSGVDYNRAGVPLIEIVSEPCMRTGAEAAAYAEALKDILSYLDVSDCNMEEGSLRIDVNVSVRKSGETALRTKIEIKNMNSFSFMEKAIEAEAKRQIAAYEAGKEIKAATYRWDPEKKETVLMRTKETAEDYRYFPEPDLPPLYVTEAVLQEIRAEQPELPLAKFLRFQNELGLPTEGATILSSTKALAHFFEEALSHCPHPIPLCNWITSEFAGRYKETGRNLINSGILPMHVASLVNMIDNKTITGKIAKAVADDMVARPGIDPKVIVKENPDYQPLNDEVAILALVEAVLADNPQSIADHKAGRDRAFGFLVGQVMKRSGGKASPELVNSALKKALI